MSLEEPDHMLIARALGYWANTIETGNQLLSIQDAINIKRPNIIKPLEPHQQKFVVKLRELALKQLRDHPV